MQNYRPLGADIPPVVKNLIIINAIMLFATWLLGQRGIDLDAKLGLFFPASDCFRPHQLVTHMFMHGDIMHLFFNMFGLYMFGRILESIWGSRRFLVYYFVTGLGAAALHIAVLYFEYRSATAALNPDLLETIRVQGFDLLHRQHLNYEGAPGIVNNILHIPTVGASGAIFGILLAFGVLFPNTELYIMFLPIPVKAKYMVIGYGLIELFAGVTNTGSNIAHFAHLGGMLFGYLLIMYWRRTTKTFY
ncbi:MAG: rhomboid family intramembrane serine protease [Bacteroidales bacterium]|jgi:membrane associated rhomboid family serine protease|nr:rhomboid family intramembrane serine protease [Bacteroidales bacterium]